MALGDNTLRSAAGNSQRGRNPYMVETTLNWATALSDKGSALAAADVVPVISVAKGTIKVSIISPNGDTTEVKNGQTVEMFAGFYRDLIKDTTGGTTVYNEGQIITSQYTMSIENTSATPLELISLLKGGIDEVAPASDPVTNPDQDYHINRRYDLPSLGVTEITGVGLASIKQQPSSQSAQVKSQYVYSRYKDYGLTNPLYDADPINGSNGYDFVLTYVFDGRSVGTETVPYNGGNYLPYDPTINTYPNGGSNADVWDGTVVAGTPGTGGTLSEFCIHTDHPILPSLNNTLTESFRPLFDLSNNLQAYYHFAHGLHFETSETEQTNVFGVGFRKQAQRRVPDAPPNNPGRTDEDYPIKLGFTPDDEFLIGKYTCGAYLYPFPLNYQTISVDGNHPSLSYKEVEVGSENSINIPILFQFRCSDKLANVGGYRTSGALTNIKYSKKIGIDIYIKDNVPFSFDLQVGCQYKKVTSLDAPVVPASGLTSVSF